MGTVEATGCFDLPDGVAIRDAVTEERDRLRALGASQAAGPLSAQALVNLVVRGSDGASAQGTLDLLPGDKADPGVARRGRRPRRYLLHLHLSEAAIRGGSEGADGAIGRVEETRAPVTASTIRDWFGAGATTHVTVLPVLDLAEAVHTEAYEVPTRLARQAELAHHSCAFPWCTRSARRCDHDHAIAFNPIDPTDPTGQGAGGPTCSCNIAPLCCSHHRLKTHGHAATRWAMTGAGDGAWLWRSPHGAHYLRDHTGTRPLDGPLADTGPPG